MQGVFYRASTKEQADKLRLSGWVRNESDGSVEMEVSGDQQSIEELISWCERGPIMARVEEVSSEDISEIHQDGFSILP